MGQPLTVCNLSPCFGPLWHIIKGSQVIQKQQCMKLQYCIYQQTEYAHTNVNKYKDVIETKIQQLLKISLSTPSRTRFTRI